MSIPQVLDKAARGGRLDHGEALALAECTDTAALMRVAAGLRDRGHGRLVEFILGSTTEYALWSGNCHVLVDQ